MKQSGLCQLAIAGLVAIGACKPQSKTASVVPARTTPKAAPSVLAAPTDTTPVLDDRSLALRGIWQQIPEFASGWTDAYQFFSDGRFVFHSSEMDCATRLASYSGHWMVSDTLIELITDTRTTRVGGHYEQATGSCGSKLSLEGATARRELLVKPETAMVYFQRPAIVQGRIHSLSAYVDTLVVAPAIGLRLGKDTWYKMREDPNAYP